MTLIDKKHKPKDAQWKEPTGCEGTAARHSAPLYKIKLTSPHAVCNVHHTPSDRLAHKLSLTTTQQIPIHKIKIDIFKFPY